MLTKHTFDYDFVQDINLYETEIYEGDMGWLEDAGVLVAEVSIPSLGVGYEIRQMERMGKPILCLYRNQERRKLFAMIIGNRKLKITEYDREEEALSAIGDFIKAIKGLVSESLSQRLDPLGYVVEFHEIGATGEDVCPGVLDLQNGTRIDPPVHLYRQRHPQSPQPPDLIQGLRPELRPVFTRVDGEDENPIQQVKMGEDRLKGCSGVSCKGDLEPTLLEVSDLSLGVFQRLDMENCPVHATSQPLQVL